MLAPYRAIFAARGAKAFSAAGAVGRLPLSMLGIGIVTMISEVTGRYALAGALTATLALAAAFFGPRVSRLVDRYGQRRVLRPVLVVTVSAVAGLLACVRLGAPDWALYGCAAAAGATPGLGSMVRSRWAALYRDSPLLHTAYSHESVVDEVCFIVGPVVSIGLSTAWFPEAGPMVAVACLAFGVLWLTAQRGTEPAPHPRERHGGRSALASVGLRVLVATFTATGVIFGAVDVTTVAFAQAQGHKGAASAVLAVYALGSCLSGVVFGLLRPSAGPAKRFLLGVAAMAVSMIPLQLVAGLPVLGVALFVAGLSVAPTMVAAMALVEQLVPRSRLTEGMTWTSTGLAVGVAVGSSAAGRVVDAAGPAAGYLVPLAAGALGLAVALLGYRRLVPAPRREGRGDGQDAYHRHGDFVA